MCGIAVICDLQRRAPPQLRANLEVMNDLIAHRGPDGTGTWVHDDGFVGFGHRRLSIIDLEHGAQPMRDADGNWVTYNGEIYNYRELRKELGVENFITNSDTEVILHAYRKWGRDCVQHFRGMFAFALWDANREELFCARDRFGIKPFYYHANDGCMYIASEVKGLLPFVDEIATSLDGLRDYLAFQFCLAGKTLFKEIYELQPAHTMVVRGADVSMHRYWEEDYEIDLNTDETGVTRWLRKLIEESVSMHTRSDVPIGAYLSGGLDSSTVAALAARSVGAENMAAFTGRFDFGPEYDESRYAQDVAHENGFALHEVTITAQDFMDHVERVIYHMDYPAAGPGSFPQYMVSGLASQHRKVVLGGQGGDEVFGGYARYLIAYFEQCIKAAINGTSDSGNFVVTYESIIPNLVSLQKYKPMLQHFWQDGLFDSMDARYFRLINRTSGLGDEIRWDRLGEYSPLDTFGQIFHGARARENSYFDLMSHFDLKTLLPALLHVEDRVSMAHGIESRVPLLDHLITELAATVPALIKFRSGELKRCFRMAAAPFLPDSVLERKDKMGFPTPLNEWARGEARPFVHDLFSSQRAGERELIDNRIVLQGLESEPKFGRKLWGFLCLEIWQRQFHDRAHEFRALRKTA